MDDATPVEPVSAPVVVRVIEEYHVAHARQAAGALAKAIGLGLVATSDVSTSVSELAANLFFHATRGGAITMAAVGRNGEVGIEVIAEDDGPGIPDVKSAMEDRFSTNGGLGGGLPGVERLMDEFEIRSTVSVGTRIAARKWRPCG